MAYINGEQYRKEEVQCPHVSMSVAPVTIYGTRKLVEKGWKNPKLLENGFFSHTSSHVSQSS